MIDPKIREAWQWVFAVFLSQPELWEKTKGAAEITFNAYVKAEARVRMAEFKLEHHNCERYEYVESVAVGRSLICNDPRHNRTLADWEKEVREELEKP
jgi:hypothetical protein